MIVFPTLIGLSFLETPVFLKKILIVFSGWWFYGCCAFQSPEHSITLKKKKKKPAQHTSNVGHHQTCPIP